MNMPAPMRSPCPYTPGMYKYDVKALVPGRNLKTIFYPFSTRRWVIMALCQRWQKPI